MPFSPLLERAVELAAEWHDGTYRKSRWRSEPFETDEPLRVPMMAHVTTVALTVQRAGFSDETVAAAFLHDLVEDRNRHGEAFAPGELAELMGERVAALVAAVTEPRRDEHGAPMPWRSRKEAYLAQLAVAPVEALGLSLADKLHNVWSMNRTIESGQDLFTAAPGRTPLSAGPAEQVWFYRSVLALAEPVDDDRLAPLRDRLREELDRFETLLAACS
jgi:(p)ppGpp synthase/HD superfamily hydrolase